MRLTAAVVAILRRLRAERGVMAFLFILVATTSFLVAVSPRLLDRVSDDGLRDRLARATAVQRNIEFTTVDRIDPGTTPFAGVAATTEALWDRIPESVQRIIGDRRYVVSSPRFRVADPPNYTTFVTFAYQDGLENRIAYTAGRPPARVAQPTGGAPAAIEIALSEEAATETHIVLGDTLHVTVDPGDPIMRNLFPRPTGAADVTVVGLYTVPQPDADYWFDDTRMIRAAIGGTVDNPIAYTTGLIAPDAYADVLALQLPTAYRWRFYVDGTRSDAGQLDALVPDLRRLKTEFDSSGGVADALPNLRTGLGAVVDRYLAERATAEAALAVAALGPIAVAAGALGLIAILDHPPPPTGHRAGSWTRRVGPAAARRAAGRGPDRHGPGGTRRPGPRLRARTGPGEPVVAGRCGRRRPRRDGRSSSSRHGRSRAGRAASWNATIRP